VTESLILGVAMICAAILTLLGMHGVLLLLLRICGSEDLGRVIREVMLINGGYVVVERREYPSLSEEFFKGRSDER